MDCLKPLDSIHQPDSRSQGFARLEETGFVPHSLALRHADVAAIKLHDGVPEAIRVQFDVARNLFLYAWHVYRFGMVARLHAYSTLEMALRERATLEGLIPAFDRKGKERHVSFRELLEIAIQTSWVSDAGFEIARDHLEYVAEQREMYAQIGHELLLIFYMLGVINRALTSFAAKADWRLQPIHQVRMPVEFVDHRNGGLR